jgi:hypothetical protein
LIPFNFLLHYSYLYRYKQHRQTIKNLLESNESIETAKSLIDNVITEHDNYITSRNIPIVFDDVETTSVTTKDTNSLHHAKDHIGRADTDTQQRQAAIDALNEE